MTLTALRPIALRVVGLCTLAALLGGCGLPRTGPTRGEILSGAELRQGDALVLPVDDRVLAVTSAGPVSGFAQALTAPGVLGSDTIRPGDTLGLQVWENVDQGLLADAGRTATRLEEVQVDGEGFVFVPYAGRIRAAGASPEALRRLVTARLEQQTPDPQVLVSRLAGDGATVSVMGGVGAQGVYPIERPTRTLTAMLARAGGVSIPLETARVSVVRAGASGTVWLDDLYRSAGQDIALREGDRILVEEDARSFTALGATGQQARVPFATRTISAVEAIAAVGGLDARLADPTGVFVLRTESAQTARALTGRAHAGPRRVAYVLDLTRPEGLFIARDFAIRDGDTVYVTEAPYSQFAKIVTAVIMPLNTAGAVGRLATN